MSGTKAATSSVSDAASELLSKDFAKSWIWDEDGDTIEGKFVRLTSGMTRDYGRQPIVVLDVNGTERSVWVMHTALATQMRECKPKVGDTIAIRRLEKVKNLKGNYSYYPYKVVNISNPNQDADWSILGSDETPIVNVPAADEDDLPF